MNPRIEVSGCVVEFTTSGNRENDPWLILESEGRRIAIPFRTAFGVLGLLAEAVLQVEELERVVK